MIKLEIGTRISRFSGDDPEVLKALYKGLSFRHPQAFFISQKIKGEWDGKIHPMSKNGTLATGLIPKALEMLNVEDLMVVDKRALPIPGEIPEKVGPLILRPYQIEAVRRILYGELYGLPWPRGFIFAGMGAGKTLIMMATYVGFNKARTIILVESSKLYLQLKSDLHIMFPNEYGYMQGKGVKWGNIMVCMVKTVNNRLQEFKSEFDTFKVMLVDEADLAGNATFLRVFKEFQNAPVRIGFSGTVFLRDLKKDALRNNTLREYFGDVLFSITAKELEDSSFTTKAIIKLLPGLPGGGYDTFMDEFNGVIGENEKHYGLVLKRVRYNLMTHKWPIMVFTRYIKQTEALGKFLQERLPGAVEYVHHKRSNQKILENFKAGKIPILVCSLFLKRGLSFPLVRCIINDSAGEFYSNPLQILGRGTRTNEGKKKVFYFEDFMDGGEYLTKHSKQRVLQYKREKYTIRDLRG